MTAVLARLLAMLLAIATCGGANAEIEGIWRLASFTAEGVETPVEVGVNAARTPWVEFDGGITGNAGCNWWGAPSYAYSRGRLSVPRIDQTALLCDGLMTTERATLQRGRWGEDASVVIEIDGDEMTWWVGETRLDFIRIGERPPDASP